MDPRLVTLALQEAPVIVAALRALFSHQHPTDAAPTDAEVIAAWQSAFASSLAVDAQWLAAHPPPV